MTDGSAVSRRAFIHGVTREYSAVRFIVSHGGGVAPLLIRRIAQFDGWTGMDPDTLRASFRTLYFEGAQAFSPVNLEALMKLVPASHILFGTDYNRFPLTDSAKLLAGLKRLHDVRRGIERDNAITLFSRLA
jgi:predicted TIM-barrel fold metal-dependent hydrolase